MGRASRSPWPRSHGCQRASTWAQTKDERAPWTRQGLRWVPRALLATGGRSAEVTCSWSQSMKPLGYWQPGRGPRQETRLERRPRGLALGHTWARCGPDPSECLPHPVPRAVWRSVPCQGCMLLPGIWSRRKHKLQVPSGSAASLPPCPWLQFTSAGASWALHPAPDCGPQQAAWAPGCSGLGWRLSSDELFARSRRGLCGRRGRPGLPGLRTHSLWLIQGSGWQRAPVSTAS